MSASKHLDVFRKFIEDGLPSKDLAVLSECLHDDVALPEGVPQGLAAFHAHLANEGGELESVTSIKDVVVDGDLLAARMTVEGKHVGNFMGVPASGKDFKVDDMIFVRFREEKIDRMWRVIDMFSLMHQIQP